MCIFSLSTHDGLAVIKYWRWWIWIIAKLGIKSVLLQCPVNSSCRYQHINTSLLQWNESTETELRNTIKYENNSYGSEGTNENQYRKCKNGQRRMYPKKEFLR